MWRYLPNFLTLLRLVATPLTLYLILKESLGYAFTVFAFAGITDLIDGYLARRWHIQSKFGQIFDPLADKALMLGCFITLAYEGYISSWFFFIMITRDICLLIGSLIVLALKLPIKLQPSFISKVNTTLQILFIAGILVRPTLKPFIPFNDDYIFNILMGTTVATTLWSGLKYGMYFVNQLSTFSKGTHR